MALGDRMYVLGGGSYVFNGDEPGNPTGYRAYNDVWSSADGVHWRRETAAAPWHPRIWFSATAYRDRLWVVGGWSSSGVPRRGRQRRLPTHPLSPASYQGG